MKSAPIPHDENIRHQALLDLQILDTPAENRFDRLTRIAQKLFKVDIALVSLVDSNRQWFKSKQGLDACETGRDISFCGHAIMGQDIFQITNAAEDPRFADNPLVTAAPNIRFYAGAPLRPDGKNAIGTLCIIDSHPRTLSDAELHSLRDLADCVEQELFQFEQQQQHQSLLALTRIASVVEPDYPTLLRMSLASACSFLRMSNGMINRNRHKDFEVLLQSTSGLPCEGQVFALNQTLYSKTLQNQTLTLIPDIKASPYAELASSAPFAQNSFVGIPIQVNGAVFGTLVFTDEKEHLPASFSNVEIEFIHLFSEWLNTKVYEWQLATKLNRQQQLAHVISRTQLDFIHGQDRSAGFAQLLKDVVNLTESSYGLIGEVIKKSDGQAYLKTYAEIDIHDDAWSQNQQPARANTEIELSKLHKAFRESIFQAKATIHQETIAVEHSFNLKPGQTILTYSLSIPIFYDSQLVALIVLGNRPFGYNEDSIQLLNPICLTVGQLIQATRVQAQHAEAEERLASAFDLLEQSNRIARIGSWQFDLTKQEFHWSHVVSDLFGLNRTSNPSLQEISAYFKAGEDRANFEHFIRVSQKAETSFDQELAIVTSAGEHKWIQLIGLSEFLDDRCIRLQGTMQDITERKQAEAMKAEFISTVSHELRTPLTSIAGSIGLIVGGAVGDLPAKINAMLVIAHKNTLRLSYLINDLLDMEKLSAGRLQIDMQYQALAPIIANAVENSLPAGIERMISIQVDNQARDISCMVDAQRLLQVLSNLISNAIKYSPTGGNIAIVVQHLHQHVRVSITDHGPGIAIDFQKRIFQKFAQADSSDTRKVGGAGLGLAISKNLIEAMHGRLNYTSTPGEGATFFFDLPVHESTP